MERAIEGRWLECCGDTETTFEVVYLESQGYMLFTETKDGHAAVTGRLQTTELTGSWRAALSNGAALTLRSEEPSVLLKEKRHGNTVETGRARRLHVSPEFERIVAQGVGVGETMKIQAAPGSGKTTALREWCRGNPNMRILFLSYSKSVQIQQEKNFKELANVSVRTIHSVAYEAMAVDRRSIGELSKSAIKDACRVGWDQADRIRTDLHRFLASADPICAYPEKVRCLWQKIEQRLVKNSHDCYLKQFQLWLKDQLEPVQAIQDYDAIMLDEAQDCTDAMLDIVHRLAGVAKVLAYDCHQNISHFRGVTSSRTLISMPATYVRSLPQSFRFGPSVADLLSRFIQHHKNQPSFTIRGDESKATTVCDVGANVDKAYEKALRPESPASRDKPKLAVLARKNSTLFNEVIRFLRSADSHGKKLFFAGGWESYNEQIMQPVMDLHRLKQRQHDQISDAFVRRYDSLDKLRFVVESQEMVDWMVKLEIYDASKSRFPELLQSIEAALASEEAGADVIYSTVHRAKGLGWRAVLLMNDFLKSHNGSIPEEEINICYVALSRAIGALYLTFQPIITTTRASLPYDSFGDDDYSFGEDDYGFGSDYEDDRDDELDYDYDDCEGWEVHNEEEADEDAEEEFDHMCDDDVGCEQEESEADEEGEGEEDEEDNEEGEKVEKEHLKSVGGKEEQTGRHEKGVDSSRKRQKIV